MNKRRRFKAKRRRLQAKWLRDAERAMALPRWIKVRPWPKEWTEAIDKILT